MLNYIYKLDLIESDYGWYVYNADGDVVALADGNGVVTRNYEYDPYGVELGENNSQDVNPYRYSGEYTDLETGYVYLRARYYDSSTGRFINQDPAMDGGNWYIYCNGNPLLYVDPTGLASGFFGWLEDRGNDLLDATAGYFEEIDSNVLFGAGAALRDALGGSPYQPKNYDAYYYGKVGGDLASIGAGLFEIDAGGKIAIASLAAGGLIEVGSAGIATPVAAPVAVGGATAGVAVSGVGVLTIWNGTKGFLQNFNNLRDEFSGGGSQNIEKVSDKYLKKKGIDAEELKKGIVGEKNGSKFDVYVDKDTGELYVYRKGGKGEGQPTGEFIK